MSDAPALKIAIIAHFMSMNMGDRYQGAGILRHLLELPAIQSKCQVDCINIFPGTEIDPDIWPNAPQVDGAPVLNIRTIDAGDYDFIIMPTGSISHRARFVGVALAALNSKRLRHIFMWGGLTRTGDRARVIDHEIEALRPLFSDPRVTFLARTWQDFAASAMIASQDRCRIGGDPIILYQPDIHSRANRAIPPNLRVPMIWNGNAVATEALSSFVGLRNVTTYNVSIDPDQDSQLKPHLDNLPLENLSNMDEFIKQAPTWRGVVTSRLHGGIMAKRFNAQCPVLFLPCDLAAPFSASQKFHASALSTYEPDAAIGLVDYAYNIDLVRRFLEAPEAFFSYEHEYHFMRYMLLTQKTMKEIGAEIIASI